MKAWTRWMTLTVLAMATVSWVSGCSKTESPPSTEPQAEKEGAHTEHTGDAEQHKEDETAKHHEGEHKEGGHKEGEHKEGGHQHAGALSERDVKMPDSFKAGIARLEQLHEQIAHQVEHNELSKVHRVAEEMALVAKKMKDLARAELPEEKQTDAGRLCNEISGFFQPIDEVADAGKKEETLSIHKQMADTIMKLKTLVQ